MFACVFSEDYSKILLLYRNAEKRKKGGADWGNVGGAVEADETSAQACSREIMEEIGVDIRADTLKLICVREELNFKQNVLGVQFIYATTISVDTKIRLNAKAPTLESERYEWFDVSKLPDSMLDSKEDIARWRDAAQRNGMQPC
ncbi:MAG: NUDIX domain-containing protein [Candidatus Marsarchaeota archaeon]|nr:NUDIX domain-containing protein [Candidatus Marsarchaeota archaeon]